MIAFLHGFTGAPASWDEVAERLSDHGPLLHETLLGHGGEELDGAADFDAEVDRVARRMAAAGVARAHLVGYSLGARVSLGLVTRHPGLFKRATIIGAHPGLVGEADRAQRIGADERWAMLLEREGIERFVREWERQPLFATQQRVPGALLARQRAIRLAHRPRGLARSLRVLGLGRMPDQRDALRRAQLPIRFIAGALDDKFRVLAVALSTIAPRGSHLLVEGAGHNVPLERPDALAAAIRHFEKEQP